MKYEIIQIWPKLKIVMKIQFPIYRVSQLHPQDSHKNMNEDQTFSHKELDFGIYQSSWAFVMAIEYGSKYMVKHLNLWIPRSEYFHKSPKFAKCLKLGQPSSHQRPFQNLRCHFMQFAFSVHLATAESKFGFDANCVCLLGYMCINQYLTAQNILA